MKKYVEITMKYEGIMKKIKKYVTLGIKRTKRGASRHIYAFLSYKGPGTWKILGLRIMSSCAHLFLNKKISAFGADIVSPYAEEGFLYINFRRLVVSVLKNLLAKPKIKIMFHVFRILLQVIKGLPNVTSSGDS